jgi:hypothetical protein
MQKESTDQLSETERTIESVRNSASGLLAAFRSKLDQLRGNDEITNLLLREGFDNEKCFEEALKFFGTEQVRYLAIDGTKFEDDRLDMIIFYAGAFAYGGALSFSKEEVFVEGPRSSEDSSSLSSAIPVSEEYASTVNSANTEGGEIDPQRVSSALMCLSEYYLAYTLIMRDPKIRVLLMDRTVSGDIAHISWKMREYIEEGNSFLEDFKTPLGKITRADLELGRMLIANHELHLPAPRSHLLKYAAMDLLIREGPLTPEEIIAKLGANEHRTEFVRRELDKTTSFKGSYSVGDGRSTNETISVSDSLKSYWERLLFGVLELANYIFHLHGRSHPLLYKGTERWITAADIDYLTLIIISAVLSEAWKRNILLLGIVKDSAANELVRTVVPILKTAGLVKLAKDIPKFESDKMLLQANSLVNNSILGTPWRTFEYDVCFRTISPEEKSTKKGECSVRGAFKNVIAPERMFVKAYFQLWKSEKDPTVRSHVFLYDRPCYPKYDAMERPELILNHWDGVNETIVPAIHFLNDAPISELIMGILCKMGEEPIPEALGHNYPLFLADKRAKIAESEAKKTCSAAVDLEISRSRLDQQILYERRYRDYRTEIESKRKSK